METQYEGLGRATHILLYKSLEIGYVLTMHRYNLLETDYLEKCILKTLRTSSADIVFIGECSILSSAIENECKLS